MTTGFAGPGLPATGRPDERFDPREAAGEDDEDAGGPSADLLAAELLTALRGRGETLATAESLTGGLLGAALTSVPGASNTYRGGIVAYATELKATLLGVDPGLLAAHGAVHPEVATAMARGAADRLGASHGLATTGVAGPEPQDGRPVGTVFVAVTGPMGTVTRRLDLRGSRAEIRRATVLAALKLALTLTPTAHGHVAPGNPGP